VDLTRLAVELLDGLPANRTLGLFVVEAADGVGKAVLPVSDGEHNVLGALHSSGIAALADAAALAAVLSVAPGEPAARRLQPLGIQARFMFERPLRGTAVATCRLDRDTAAAVTDLYRRGDGRARVTTLTTIDGDDAPTAARGEFDWTLRLARQ